MLGTPHAISTILRKQGPTVKLLDTAESTSALTTYTFSAVNLGDLGGTASIAGETYNNFPNSRAASRKYIIVCVHGENSVATFSVSSVTIGGVSGTSRSDRGGGTNAIDTALFSFDTASLDGITNTDVVVTWSGAITGCAIGVLLVENAGVLTLIGSPTGVTGTGVLTTTATHGGSLDRHTVAILASTCATGGGTEKVQFYIGEATSSFTPCHAPTLLYEKSNANFDYAACWSFAPGYFSANAFTFNTTWSGTGAGDACLITFY